MNKSWWGEGNKVLAVFTRLTDDSAIAIVNRLRESFQGVLFQKMKRPEGDDITDESRRIGCHPIQLGWHTPSERVITVRAAILAIMCSRTDLRFTL